MLSRLEDFANSSEFTEIKKPIEASIAILQKYYKKADLTPVSVICLILNPAIKMEYIKMHWDDNWNEKAQEILEETFDKYYIPPNAPMNENTPGASVLSPVRIGCAEEHCFSTPWQ
ncbi:hypothetical protein M422DRAFT_34607 [Sphaerobolus stellatus SS14]|uniref:hAT-like transposase RNase-H fold domain-containing protein n=1 Tax=Sphaerobolus stellatus (strain SS14) TaxID=990650 RepID=A0A0C9V1J4_SPHS4|nr:hypothetical protein M422DRAFT_34607 [Sphaerobolus stellatus SS14]